MNIVKISEPEFHKGFITFHTKVTFGNGHTVRSISINDSVLKKWYESRKFNCSLEDVIKHLFTDAMQENLVRFAIGLFENKAIDPHLN